MERLGSDGEAVGERWRSDGEAMGDGGGTTGSCPLKLRIRLVFDEGFEIT